MSGGDSIMLGSLDPSSGTPNGLLKLSVNSNQAMMRYAGWVLINFSTAKPAMVRMRGLVRR